MLKDNVSEKHYVNKFGIYKVIKKHVDGVWIRSITNVRVFIKRKEYMILEGGNMKLTELARTLKFLEILKWKVLTGEVGNKRHQQGYTPIESYLINEFPFGSAFCYVFRDFKCKKKVDGKFSICFCPKKPWEHLTEWARTQPPENPNIAYPEGRRINCILNADGSHRDTKEMIKSIEVIKIMDIVKMLKKIKIPADKLLHLSRLYHFHVWSKISISRIESCSDSKNLKDIKELYRY